jgi:retron-type reverse transcriptase
MRLNHRLSTDATLKQLGGERIQKYGENEKKNFSISISPVLMNIYLHELDLKVRAWIQEGTETIGYARYADDMLFSISKGHDSEQTYIRFFQFFHLALKELKLAETSITLTRTIPRQIRVLGLVLGIDQEGALETSAPLKRWQTPLRSLSLFSKSAW